MDAKILKSKKISSGDPEKKKKVQILVMILLGIVFLYLLISTFLGGSKAKPATAKKPPAFQNQASKVTGLGVAAVDDSLNMVLEEDGWGKSPFSMETPEAEPVVQAKESLQLQGIVFGKGDASYAMINEKIVKKGERIADNTVKEIQQDQVILETDNGQTVTLRNE